MSDLKTHFMGIEMANPFMVGSSSLTADMPTLRRLQEAGAGAVVIKTLFEEQVQLERFKLEEELSKYNDLHAMMVNVLPDLDHGGPEEHLMWVKRAVKELDIPVIGSINAVEKGTWIEYSKKLENTGVHGLELNLFESDPDINEEGQNLEDKQLDIIKEVVSSVDIPVSIKITPHYTNLLNFIRKADVAGAEGFVLFNRLMQPDIDLKEMKVTSMTRHPGERDYGSALRYAGMLSGSLEGDVCGGIGIENGTDAARSILAGSSAVQVTGILYKRSVEHLKTMVSELSSWMDENGYQDIQAFKGALSRQKVSDPFAYTRAQYIRMMMGKNPFDHRPVNR